MQENQCRNYSWNSIISFGGPGPPCHLPATSMVMRYRVNTIWNCFNPSGKIMFYEPCSQDTTTVVILFLIISKIQIIFSSADTFCISCSEKYIIPSQSIRIKRKIWLTLRMKTVLNFNREHSSFFNQIQNHEQACDYIT